MSKAKKTQVQENSAKIAAVDAEIKQLETDKKKAENSLTAKLKEREVLLDSRRAIYSMRLLNYLGKVRRQCYQNTKTNEFFFFRLISH